MFIKTLLLSLLLLNLGELVNSSVIRLNNVKNVKNVKNNGIKIMTEEADDLGGTTESLQQISKRFFETEFLVFERFLLTEGKSTIYLAFKYINNKLSSFFKIR